MDDTAEEDQPQFGCPNPAPNSCPGKPANQPALDPVTNFMVSSAAPAMLPQSLLDDGCLWTALLGNLLLSERITLCAATPCKDRRPKPD